jgi:hypothetical protein
MDVENADRWRWAHLRRSLARELSIDQLYLPLPLRRFEMPSGITTGC